MATFAISRLYSTLRTNNCQAIQHVWAHKMKLWAHACNALHCLFWIRSRAWVTLCIYNRSGFSALQKNLWKCWERVHVCAYADQAFQLCGKLIRYSDLVYLISTNVQHTFCLNACMHTWCRAQDCKQYVEICVHHLSIFILAHYHCLAQGWCDEHLRVSKSKDAAQKPRRSFCWLQDR